MQLNKYFVYIFYDSHTGVPYYVGKGSGNRIEQHINFSKNRKRRYPLTDKLYSLHKNKQPICYTKVVDGVSESCALETEIFLIAQYKRRSDGGSLLNLTLGGEGKSGIKPWNAGKSIPLESRKKTSEGLKEFYRFNKSSRLGATDPKGYKSASSDPRAWSNAGKFYLYWNTLSCKDRALSRIFPDISRTIFKTIIREFDQGWIPNEDLVWKEKYQDSLFTLKEHPLYAIPRVSKPQVYMAAETIYGLYLEGLRTKAIAKALGFPTSNLHGVILKIKSGWNPSIDANYQTIKLLVATTESLDD